MAGLIFGKYEKIRRLAEGGMGDVWLARQKATVIGFDRLVILKSLKHDLAKEPGFVEQFLDEARVAATLNHPNIVALYEVGEWDETYYIAMEYIAGDDLSRLWYSAAKRGVGLPFQVSVKIVHDACLALDHAHHAVDMHGKALSIVHRDVSPQNIMVRADGVTKLVDFGIAKAANRVSVTTTGTVKGKLQYMSPEQVRGEAVDGRSDQFSLGIVLWEMCTGKRLFKAETELATLNKILQLPIPPPQGLVPGFPVELERVILRMLERERGRRYARSSEVARELRGYLDRASAVNGEVTVADFVEEILGQELRARTADLTPAPPTAEVPVLDEASQPTEERPAFYEHSPSVLMKRAVGDGVRRFTDENQLHQWIIDGQVARDDLVSEDGERWHRAGDRPGYERFFEVADAQRRIDEEAARHGDDAAHPATLDLLREPPTQSGEVPRPLSGDDELDDPLATQPVPALVFDDDERDGRDEHMPAPRQPPTRVKRDEQAHGGETVDDVHGAEEAGADATGDDDPTLDVPRRPVSKPGAETGFFGAPAEGSPPTAPVPALRDLDDLAEGDLVLSRGGALKWVAAGMVVVLLAGGALLVLVDDELRERVAGALGASAAPSVDLAAAFDVLARDDAAEQATYLSDVTKSIESSKGEERALKTALASMLESAHARRDHERARLLRLAGDASHAAALEGAKRHRVMAYKLASEARSAAGDIPAAFLAMAAYQAERAGVVEADADLASMSDALSRRPPPEPIAARYRAEGEVQRALASLCSSAGKGDVSADALAVARQGDARAWWALHVLRAEGIDAANVDEAKALLADVAPRAPGGGERARLLTTWLTTRIEAATRPAPPLAPPKPKPAPSPSPPVEEASPEDTRSADELVAAAKEAQDAGKSFQAATLYRKAIGKDPARGDALIGAGWAYLDLGKGDAAVRSFQKAASLEGAPVEAFFGLGEAHRFTGNKPQAIRAYERYLERSPEGPDAKVAKNAIAALRE